MVGWTLLWAPPPPVEAVEPEPEQTLFVFPPEVPKSSDVDESMINPWV